MKSTNKWPLPSPRQTATSEMHYRVKLLAPDIAVWVSVVSAAQWHIYWVLSEGPGGPWIVTLTMEHWLALLDELASWTEHKTLYPRVGMYDTCQETRYLVDGKEWIFPCFYLCGTHLGMAYIYSCSGLLKWKSLFTVIYYLVKLISNTISDWYAIRREYF